MPNLTFYRQKRFDGGIRTGVELSVEHDGVGLSGATILEHFEMGEEERDPSLLWFVDVRFKGPGVPGEAEAACQWLLTTRSVIEGGLARFADKLRDVGSDVDDHPLQWSDFPGGDDGVERKVVCSAIRRIDARGYAEILDDIRTSWEKRIEEMIAENASISSMD